MSEKESDHIGIKLKELREEFKLNQEEWAKLLQVTPNTVARWERGELEPKGAHRKKADQMIAISKDEKTMDTIKSTLNSDGGLAGVAAFLGMLFGVLGVLGISLGMAQQLLKSKSSLLEGIDKYISTDEEKEEK
jgi:DNA-binding XRE family transcriptional regulator